MSFSKTIKPASFFKDKLYITGGGDHERIALTICSCLATIIEASPGYFFGQNVYDMLYL